MLESSILLIAATALVLVVVFSCLTLVALTAIGKDKNVAAESDIKGIRVVAQEALKVVDPRPKK